MGIDADLYFAVPVDAPKALRLECEAVLRALDPCLSGANRGARACWGGDDFDLDANRDYVELIPPPGRRWLTVWGLDRWYSDPRQRSEDWYDGALWELQDHLFVAAALEVVTGAVPVYGPDSSCNSYVTLDAETRRAWIEAVFRRWRAGARSGDWSHVEGYDEYLDWLASFEPYASGGLIECLLCGLPIAHVLDHGLGKCCDVCAACGGDGDHHGPGFGIDCKVCSGLGGVRRP